MADRRVTTSSTARSAGESAWLRMVGIPPLLLGQIPTPGETVGG